MSFRIALSSTGEIAAAATKVTPRRCFTATLAGHGRRGWDLGLWGDLQGLDLDLWNILRFECCFMVS